MTVPKHFEEARTTLKMTSFDDSNQVYMTESEIPVYNFDAIKEWYKRFRMSKTSETLSLKSNDALFVNKEGQAYFIEFKNGNLDSGERKQALRQKLYDSFIILADKDTCTREVIPSFESPLEYTRDHMGCIVVYNEAANPVINKRKKTREHVETKAGMARFGLARFQGFIYRNVYTVTEKEFQTKFVNKWENKEMEARN